MNTEEKESLFSLQDPDIKELLKANNVITGLQDASAFLEWDQSIYMPPGAATLRADQLAVVSVIAHEKETDTKLGNLLKKLEDRSGSGALTLHDLALVRETRRMYDEKTKLPADFVEKKAKTKSLAFDAWQKAKKESDFSLFAEHLKKVVECQIQEAEYLGYEVSPYDALLNKYEPGLTTKDAEAMFAPLKAQLPGMIKSSCCPDRSGMESFLFQEVDREIMEKFALEVIKSMGFNFSCGRLDVSAHPFTSSAHSAKDVRITTRYGEESFLTSFFSTVHEAGHALYEQGVDPRLEMTLLGAGVSLGIHETNSRFWENLICKNKPFWIFWYPKLAEALWEGSNTMLPPEKFFQAINMVDGGLIRVNADEASYNLHVALRFDIEKDLILGNLRAEEVQEAWAEKTEEYFGITPETPAEGCLQDIHWSYGLFGYFPTYTIGNLFSAQILATLLKTFPDFTERIARGELLFVREWLKENIHRHGGTYSPKELILRTTGEPLDPNYFLSYIKDKTKTLFG